MHTKLSSRIQFQTGVSVIRYFVYGVFSACLIGPFWNFVELLKNEEKTNVDLLKFYFCTTTQLHMQFKNFLMAFFMV